MPDKKTIQAAVAVFLLVILAYSMRFVANRYEESNMAWFITSLLRSGIYIGLFIVWGVSVRRRIIQAQTKRYLSAVSALLVFWMAVRTLKFMIFDNPHLCRYLWYLYYIPQIIIPLLLVMVACFLGKPEGYRLPKWTNLLYIPAATLLLLILTNDLHQLAFGFPKGLTYIASGEYTHEIVYFLAIGWILLGVLTALVLIFIKCRVPGSKKRIWLPCIPILVLVAYWVLSMLAHNAIKRFAGDMTVISCLLCIAMLEGFIRGRLIPSNTNYDELFRISEVHAHITDENYNILLSTNNAKPLSAKVLRSAEEAPVMLNDRIRLSSVPIKRGHALWTDDIWELQNVLNELHEIQENMEDENAVLSEEYKLKSREAHIAEQDRLYNEIQRQTARQITLLSKLTEQFEQAETEEKHVHLLGQMTVIGAYLKRRNNLIFISDKTPLLNVRELELAFRESLSNLELYGVDCGFTNELIGKIPAAAMMAMYDFFEEIVERSLDSMSAVHIVTGKKDECLFITINTDSKADLKSLAVEHISAVQDDDGEWQLTKTLGGDAL